MLRQSAFSLPEVLVAFLLITVVITGLLRFQEQLLRIERRSLRENLRYEDF